MQKKAFTLIELMIAITIVVLLTMATYAPYNYYQNKAKLKVSVKEISQLLYESRNKAINGAIWNNSNVSIWVYFSSDPLENNKIQVLSYPYDIDPLAITYLIGWQVQLEKTLVLRQGIQLDEIEWRNDFLMVFDAITWNKRYYTWQNGVRVTLYDSSDSNPIDPDLQEVDISFSFKWSTSPNFQKTIHYISSTNIIDY